MILGQLRMGARQAKNAPLDRSWPGGLFELCSKNIIERTLQDVSFKLPQVDQKENARSNQCLVCMKQDQTHNMKYFGIEKCSRVSNSNRIVIPIEQQKDIDDWKNLQKAEQILSDIMYSDTHVLFRIQS